MKVVFLQDDFPPNSFGGAGISTFELAQAVRAQGHEVAVITTCRKQSEAGETEYQGLRVFRIATTYSGRWRGYVSVYNPPAVRQLATLLDVLRPDVVHANNVHAYLSWASLKIAKRYSKVVVWTARDVMSFNYGKLVTKEYLGHLDAHTTWVDHIRQAGMRWNPLRNACIKWYLRYVDKKCAVSSALQKALAQNGIHNVEAIWTGMDMAQWQLSEARVNNFVQKYGLTGKDVIFFGGRLSAEKGGGVTLRALALVATKIPHAVLLVAGVKDAFAEAMQEEAQTLGVADRVMYTGWITGDDLVAAYGASAVAVVPSVCFDSLPRMVLEAMAAGKPVVATRYGGAPEAVLDGETGYVVDPREPKQIAAKLEALLADPAAAEAMGAAARRRIEQHFNLSAVAASYIDHYRRIIDGKE